MDAIITQRLILKPLDEAWADSVLSFYQENKEFEKYESSRAFNFYTREYIEAVLKYEYTAMEREQGIRYWIFPLDNPDQIIGTVSFQNIARGIYQNCQLGYKIHKDFQGMGYATEAVQNACQEIFEELELHKIEAYTMKENTASKKVLLKCGFQYEGLSRDRALIQGQWQDHEQYSLIR